MEHENYSCWCHWYYRGEVVKALTLASMMSSGRRATVKFHRLAIKKKPQPRYSAGAREHEQCDPISNAGRESSAGVKTQPSEFDSRKMELGQIGTIDRPVH